MKDNNPVCPMCAKPVIEPVSVPTESCQPISHDDALKAAQSLIDHYFHNPGRDAVQCRIPRELTDTDVLLTDYILQQKELAAPSEKLLTELATLVEERLPEMTNEEIKTAESACDAIIERIKTRLASLPVGESRQQIDIQELRLEGKGTDHIWLMEDGGEPHTIGIRLDSGDSGVVYVTPDQAKDLAEQLTAFTVGESMPLSELELRAIAFAAKAHSCQVDKAGHSYLAHPFRVAMAVRSEGEKYFAVGMLHDVPEDTDATLAEITAEFGPEIGEAVDSLTRRKATCSYESDVIRAMTNPIGRKVKQADVADNERPERIGLLEPATQDRLRKKYAIAHRVFKEVGELGLGESREPLPLSPSEHLIVLHRRFRAAWLRQGDLTDPEQQKAEHEEMIRLSDEIRDLELPSVTAEIESQPQETGKPAFRVVERSGHRICHCGAWNTLDKRHCYMCHQPLLDDGKQIVAQMSGNGKVQELARQREAGEFACWAIDLVKDRIDGKEPYEEIKAEFLKRYNTLAAIRADSTPTQEKPSK